MVSPVPRIGRAGKWPLPRVSPGKRRPSAVTPLAAPVAGPGKPQDEIPAAPAYGGPAEPPLPPGVLGYAVGVFPAGGEACSGLVHTGMMSLESARREAGQYASAARNESFSPGHKTCTYEPVEIRRVSRG